MTLNKKLIGIRIRSKRKEKGLKQETLAELIDCSSNHLSNIERGNYLPTTSLIFKICTVLGETPNYYLIGTATKKTSEIESVIKTLPESEQEILLKLIKYYTFEISRE